MDIDNSDLNSFVQRNGCITSIPPVPIANLAKHMREQAAINNPMSRIPSSNNPPRDDEENERAKAVVDKWTEELSRAIASAHHQQQIKSFSAGKKE